MAARARQPQEGASHCLLEVREAGQEQVLTSGSGRALGIGGKGDSGRISLGIRNCGREL